MLLSWHQGYDNEPPNNDILDCHQGSDNETTNNGNLDWDKDLKTRHPIMII